MNKILPFAMLLNLFQLRPLCMMPPVFTYTTKSLSFQNNSQDHLTNTATCDGHYMYNQLINKYILLTMTTMHMLVVNCSLYTLKGNSAYVHMYISLYKGANEPRSLACVGHKSML